MSYIGKVELKASDIRTSGVITISGGATNTVALGGSAPSVQTVVLTVNGVTQATNTYTIAGSTLTLASGNFADADTVEAITVNDIGTTITPADGTVTLPKISAGTGTVGQYLKTDGVGTLSWGTVTGTTAGDITTANNFFQNWNTIDVNTTSTFATTINAAIIGPISVTGSYVWSVNGTLNIL